MKLLSKTEREYIGATLDERKHITEHTNPSVIKARLLKKIEEAPSTLFSFAEDVALLEEFRQFHLSTTIKLEEYRKQLESRVKGENPQTFYDYRRLDESIIRKLAYLSIEFALTPLVNDINLRDKFIQIITKTKTNAEYIREVPVMKVYLKEVAEKEKLEKIQREFCIREIPAIKSDTKKLKIIKALLQSSESLDSGELFNKTNIGKAHVTKICRDLSEKGILKEEHKRSVLTKNNRKRTMIISKWKVSNPHKYLIEYL